MGGMPFRKIRGASRMLGAQALTQSGWFAEQHADFQDRIASLGRWQRYSAGERLYDFGDEARALIGLEDGLIDISLPISDDEMVTLHRARAPFWMGETALIQGEPRAVSVVAHVDCLIFAIPAEPLRRHVAEYPEDALPFLSLSFANTQLALKGLSEVLALPPRPRFARMLLRLVSTDGYVRATQTELGAMAGMSRAAFRRAFSELIDAGIIATEYGKVRIVDMAALEAEAAKR
jgi:CRP-like cAMP-binding protein